MKLRLTLAISSIILGTQFATVHAQNKVDGKFGKGIKIEAKDSSFSLKFSTRIQNRYEGTITEISGADNNYTDKIYLRRARIKFDGYAFSPKVKYKMEYDVVNGFVLDAVVKWNFAGNFELWAGQTKLPGNRERVISSQKLQFVDRSQLNSKFTLDRDKGIQLRHHFNLGKGLIRQVASLSLGEGLNTKTSSVGKGYTYRIEYLPFGKFSSKGDYFSSDLKRETSPKLSIAATYDYNDNAERERGQKGDYLSSVKDLKSLQADLMFKYKGFSLMGEYADRMTIGTPINYAPDASTPVDAFYTGSAINLQAGYLLKSNWELAARYTDIDADTETGNNDINEVTIGVSKYVVGHSLKVQGDFTMRETENSDDQKIFRLQVELSL